LFWQKSNDHNIDVHYQRGMLQTEGACLCQPISWSMATILCNSIAIAVVRTHPWAIPLVMITTRKSIRGFPFLSYMGMGLCLAVLWAAGALLLMSYVHMCCFDLWYIADTRSIQMNIWKIISFNCRERCKDMVSTVFLPKRAIAGIPRCNQRWPLEKQEKGQFGPFLLQEIRLSTGIVF